MLMKTRIFFAISCACAVLCSCSKDVVSQGVWGGTDPTVPSLSGLYSATAGSNTVIYGSDKWKSVIYDGSMYLAAGDGDAVAISEDGKTWTAAVVDNITDWKGAAYGNDTYVLTGGYGMVATSADGKDWTKSSVSSAPLYGVAYGASKFVAASATGVLTSADAKEWTAASGEYSFTNLIYANNQFVATGLGNVLAYSTDGTAWTLVTGTSVPGPQAEGTEAGSTVSWYDVAYGQVGTASYYVAVGMTDRTYTFNAKKTTAYDGIIAVSSDAETWTVTRYEGKKNDDGSFQNVIFTSVDINAGIAVVGGAEDDMRYSADLSVWTPVELPEDADIFAVCIAE